jgi:hypothetical protein
MSFDKNYLIVKLMIEFLKLLITTKGYCFFFFFFLKETETQRWLSHLTYDHPITQLNVTIYKQVSI